MVAYAISLPGVSVGMANAAWGLLDAHHVETSAARGNDVMIVLHHAEPHTHARGEMPRSAGNEASAAASGGGVSHDEDHVLILPGALDISPRKSHDEVSPAFISHETNALAATRCWPSGGGVTVVLPLARGAQPRAGPPAGWRVTALRI